MSKQFNSGEWNGFYIEKNRAGKGWMHLYLSFENGEIKGEGTDYVGPWVAKGKYDESTGQCAWVKQYLNKHQVEYQGICGENGIEGKWTLPFSTGPFHIWPRSMTHLNELYLRDEMPVNNRPIGESVVDSMLLNTTSLEDII